MDEEINEKCVKVYALIWLDSLFWNFDGDNVALEKKIGPTDKRLGYLNKEKHHRMI